MDNKLLPHDLDSLNSTEVQSCASNGVAKAGVTNHQDAASQARANPVGLAEHRTDTACHRIETLMEMDGYV